MAAVTGDTRIKTMMQLPAEAAIKDEAEQGPQMCVTSFRLGIAHTNCTRWFKNSYILERE
jgi:hypothetical protein